MLIGLTRVSLPSQSDALQRDALEKAGCEKVFSDVGTGASFDRPGLNAALAFAREGDVIAVWKLDRLGRSARDILATVEELGRRGIGFRSLTENLDTDSPSGRLIFTLVAALAQAEREILAERVVHGLRAARKRGVRLGRPNALSPEKKKVAAALLAEGSLSVRDVAREVGVSPATLYRAFPRGRAAVAA